MNTFRGIEEFYNSYIKIEEIKRTGWVMRAVPSKRLETVSDHTLQVTVLSLTLCHELNLGFDISKLAQMSFIHDIGEAIIGDISEVDTNYVDKKKPEKDAVRKMLSSLSKETQERYFNFWVEMEERKTPLSQFVYQVDKLDAILKAKKYSDDYNMPELFEEFYNHQLSKGTFNVGPLKEMFDSLKD